MILSLLIVIIFILLSIKKPVYGLAFLISNLSIDTYLLFGVDTAFLVKALLLLSSILCCYRYGFKRNYIKIFLAACAFFAMSQISATYTSNYNFMNAVQSMLSIVLGLILTSITFKNDDKKIFLKTLSLLPYMSIILGMYGLHSLSFSGRYGAGTSTTNLSFIAAISCISLLALYNESKENKYMTMSFLSLALCFLTLTRGGILFCLVVLSPHFISIIRKLKRRQIAILAVLLIIAAMVIANVGPALLARMHGSSGTLNASGRIEAWAFILSQNRQFWFGEGIGKLNTLTLVGAYIDHFNAAHNEFVRFYYESGFLGLILLIVVFGNIFKEFIENNKLSKIQSLAIVLAFIIYALVDNIISNNIFFVPFMLYLNAACLNENSRKVMLKWRR